VEWPLTPSTSGAEQGLSFCYFGQSVSQALHSTLRHLARDHVLSLKHRYGWLYISYS
jgi:hypothetical protein